MTATTQTFDFTNLRKSYTKEQIIEAMAIEGFNPETYQLDINAGDKYGIRTRQTSMRDGETFECFSTIEKLKAWIDCHKSDVDNYSFIVDSNGFVVVNSESKFAVFQNETHRIEFKHCANGKYKVKSYKSWTNYDYA